MIRQQALPYALALAPLPAPAPAGRGTNWRQAPLPPLLPRLELDAAALSCLGNASVIAEGLRRLVEGGMFEAAIRLVAHALPREAAIAWACRCIRASTERPLPGGEQAALLATEDWLAEPEEERRRACMARAREAGFRGAAAMAALAAFWSGGSMAPEDAPAVPPAPHMTGVAVASAVTLAAGQGGTRRLAALLALVEPAAAWIPAVA
jgi:hypothetical protein